MLISKFKQNGIFCLLLPLLKWYIYKYIYIYMCVCIYTVKCRYNAVQFITVSHTDNNGRKRIRYYNHNRHLMARPYGRAMGCILWGLLWENWARYIKILELFPINQLAESLSLLILMFQYIYICGVDCIYIYIYTIHPTNNIYVRIYMQYIPRNMKTNMRLHHSIQHNQVKSKYFIQVNTQSYHITLERLKPIWAYLSHCEMNLR